MDPLTSVAASGLRSDIESLDVLANNLSNTQTSGFKTDREFYGLYTSAEAAEAGGYDPVQMPNIERNWIDFSQGNLRQTGNQSDFAVSGKGFFAVRGQSGTLYTRNGAFQVNAGGQLVTADDAPVLGSDGNPLQVNPAQPLEVTAQGELNQAGQTIGKFQLVSFANPAGLAKQGAGYFQFGGDPNSISQASGEISQGRLEDSNVGNAESAVRLVSVMRHFEMLQKAISIGTEMNQKAMQDVARSGA